MFIIGLTGGIGSGKTTVANLFAELGVPIIDADVISRQLVEPGQEALKEIVSLFSNDCLTINGELNRAKLRDIIFNEPDKRKQLEAILHPRIRKEMRHQASTLNSNYCIFVIPLLLETGQQQTVDRVLVVDADDSHRRQRLKSRDNMNDHDINQAFAAQVSRQTRLTAADDVITNDAGLESLRPQVATLHQRYSMLAR